jgi:hypothetical protein
VVRQQADSENNTEESLRLHSGCLGAGPPDGQAPWPHSKEGRQGCAPAQRSASGGRRFLTGLGCRRRRRPGAASRAGLCTVPEGRVPTGGIVTRRGSRSFGFPKRARPVPAANEPTAEPRRPEMTGTAFGAGSRISQDHRSVRLPSPVGGAGRTLSATRRTTQTAAPREVRMVLRRVSLGTLKVKFTRPPNSCQGEKSLFPNFAPTFPRISLPFLTIVRAGQVRSSGLFGRGRNAASRAP